MNARPPAFSIANDALDLVRASQEQVAQLAALLMAIRKEVTAKSPAHHLAGLGWQAANEWADYLDGMTKELQQQLDAAGGTQ
ncbi:hypothetical protein FQZ97_811150 [compost metagenome]